MTGPAEAVADGGPVPSGACAWEGVSGAVARKAHAAITTAARALHRAPDRAPPPFNETSWLRIVSFFSNLHHNGEEATGEVSGACL